MKEAKLWTRNFLLVILASAIGTVGAIAGGFALAFLVFDWQYIGLGSDCSNPAPSTSFTPGFDCAVHGPAAPQIISGSRRYRKRCIAGRNGSVAAIF